MLQTENALRNVVDAPAVNPTAASVSWKWVAGEVLRKLAPQVQWKNPVMFVVYIGSIITTILWLDALRGGRPDAPAGFIFAITVWLWFTVLFANAAEALAEGRGKAQADALRAARRRVFAKVLSEPNRDAASRSCASDELRAGMFVLVEAGDIIPADGEIIGGVPQSMSPRSPANLRLSSERPVETSRQ
jgi:potassium-transporting ATPase ATP-binding subunit